MSLDLWQGDDEALPPRERKRVLAMSIADGPDIFIMPMPPWPGGVAIAAIVLGSKKVIYKNGNDLKEQFDNSGLQVYLDR